MALEVGRSAGSKVSIVATTDFTGGAELYIARLAQGCVRAGVETSLLGRLRTWPDTIPSHDLEFGPKWSLRSLPLGLLRLGKDRKKLSAALSPNSELVFNCHFKREQISLTSILARHGRVVWTEHGVFPDGVFGMLLRPFYRRASRKCATILCVSEKVAISIKSLVPVGTSVVTVNSGVDLNYWSIPESAARLAVRQSLGLADTRRVCLFAGRLDTGKRPLLAIEAALAAKCHIILAGEGSLLASIKQSYLNNPNITIVGHTDDVRPFYAAADVHLFTSTGKGEGFPTVLLESSASGVPTIVCDDSGFSADVSRAGGMSSLPTVSSLSESINVVLGSRDQRSIKARVWAEGRDHEKWLSEYLRLMEVREGPVDKSSVDSRG